jgi:hypothetical protein
LLEIVTVFALMQISSQNNLHCIYDLKLKAEEYIGLLEIECESKTHETNTISTYHRTEIETRSQKFKSFRVNIYPSVENFITETQRNISKLPSNVYSQIEDLEFDALDKTILDNILTEVDKANGRLNVVNLNSFNYFARTKEDFISHSKNINLETICINQWTLNTTQSKGYNITESDCRPSMGHAKISSMHLWKIIQEMSVNEQELFHDVRGLDREVFELEKELESLKKLK